MATPSVSGLSTTTVVPAADQGHLAPQPDASRRAAAMPGGGQTGAPADTQAADSASIPLEKAITSANDNLKAWSTGMRFDIDPASGRIVVSITDSKTGDVLRTVPTDAVLRAAKMIMQMQEKSIDTRV